MALQTQRQDVASGTAAIVDEHVHQEGPLLPILHDVQKKFGCLPEEALRLVAEKLNLSRAEVYGVASFYHDFRRAPPGKHVLKICRAEACQSVGGDVLAENLQNALGVGWHETSSDGQVTLEPVYCLGLCSCAPAAMVDGELRGRLDEVSMWNMVAEVKQ